MTGTSWKKSQYSCNVWHLIFKREQWHSWRTAVSLLSINHQEPFLSQAVIGDGWTYFAVEALIFKFKFPTFPMMQLSVFLLDTLCMVNAHVFQNHQPPFVYRLSVKNSGLKGEIPLMTSLEFFFQTKLLWSHKKHYTTAFTVWVVLPMNYKSFLVFGWKMLCTLKVNNPPWLSALITVFSK